MWIILLEIFLFFLFIFGLAGITVGLQEAELGVVILGVLMVVGPIVYFVPKFDAYNAKQEVISKQLKERRQNAVAACIAKKSSCVEYIGKEDDAEERDKLIQIYNFDKKFDKAEN